MDGARFHSVAFDLRFRTANGYTYIYIRVVT